MKTTALKFGLLSGLTLLVLFLIVFFLFQGISYTTEEIIGYASILVSLSFVFFGIKSYRDQKLSGKISFGRAFGLGLLIVLIPSIVFGAFNAVYMVYLEPDFAENYYNTMLNDLPNHYSGAELAEQIASMENMKEMAFSVTFNSILMGVTVFIIGLIVSLLSAVALRKA